MDIETSARGLALSALPMGACLMLWGLLRQPGRRRYRNARHLRDRTTAILGHPALTGRTLNVGAPGAAEDVVSGHTLDAFLPGYSIDPFRTLSVQMHLTRLSSELRELAGEARRPARRRRAATDAYDDALAEACRLAGAPLYRSAGMDRTIGRQMEELALSDRGWTW